MSKKDIGLISRRSRLDSLLLVLMLFGQNLFSGCTREPPSTEALCSSAVGGTLLTQWWRVNESRPSNTRRTLAQMSELIGGPDAESGRELQSIDRKVKVVKAALQRDSEAQRFIALWIDETKGDNVTREGYMRAAQSRLIKACLTSASQ